MSYMKRWLEDSIGSFTDEELRQYGYSDENIKTMRESFEGGNEDEEKKYEFC